MDVTLLLHTNDYAEKVGDVINGKPYVLPPFEPVELPSFIAEAILTHIGHMYGIVKVRVEKSKSGMTYLIDEAITESKTYLAQCEKGIVSFYVRQQMEDRIAKGLPALPPEGIALSVVKARGISLKQQFGLVPVGWSDPGVDTPNVANTSMSPDHIKVLEQQSRTISDLQAQLTIQSERFDKLMEMLQPTQESEQEPEMVDSK